MTETLLHQPDIATPDVSTEKSVMARNAWLDEKLDPNGTLPPLTIDDRYTPMSLGGIPIKTTFEDHRLHFETDTEEIGQMVLHIPVGNVARLGSCAVVTHVEIDKAYRGTDKGYGRAAYLSALKRLPANVGLTSDATLTKGSFSIWKWLEESGVARHEGKPESLVPDEEGYYQNTHFRTVF